MEVRNCPRCGKVFTVMSSANVCKDCEKIEEEVFQTVKTYIDENRNCTMDELVAETGVAAKKIFRYIKDGRIEISKGMVGAVVCESCGEPISRGRYCDRCAIKIQNDVHELFTDPAAAAKKTGARMHISKRL